MLLLTQDKRIVNLDCMAIIDTASLQVFARQDAHGRGITLGEYDSEERCKYILGDIFARYCCDGSENVYVMPDK